MVTMGKSRSLMGRVVIEVATGDSCHSLYDLLISNPAPRKPTQTTPVQRILKDHVCKARLSHAKHSIIVKSFCSSIFCKHEGIKSQRDYAFSEGCFWLLQLFLMAFVCFRCYNIPLPLMLICKTGHVWWMILKIPVRCPYELGFLKPST